MELQTRLRLSFYKEIAEIDTAHNIRLVQHTVTGKIFVKKALSIYDLQVFQYLMTQKIPGTPKIEELIEENTTLYVIEEYISGNSLEEILAKEGTFSEEKAADYILRICRILQPLHQQHPPMIHRDLKPSNLILTYDGRLILVDFNSAKTYTLSVPKILSSLVQPDTPHRNNMAFPLPHRQLIFMRWVCCSTKC